VSFLPPRGSCVRARSKDAALLLFSLSSPSRSPSHTPVCVSSPPSLPLPLPLPLHRTSPPVRSPARSFLSSLSSPLPLPPPTRPPAPLYFCIRGLRDRVLSHPSASSAFSLRDRGLRLTRATLISGCDDNLVSYANSIFRRIMRDGAMESRDGVGR